MLKLLSLVLAIALWAAPASAEPITTAIGAAVAAAGGWGAIAVKVGASLLLSAAASALMPEPDAQQVRGRQTTTRQPVAPRELVYGRSRKGGTIAFLHTTPANFSGAAPNAVLHLIVVVAAHEVEKLGNVYFDGQLAFPEGSLFPTARYSPGGNTLAFCQRRNGNPGQAPLSSLTSETNGLWSAAHRLDGCAHLYFKLFFDTDVFPTGIPNVTVDVWGKNDVLDPRTGTRSYTENAALCLADYMSLTDFGIGAAIDADDGINEATLIESANVCDEIVTEVGNTTDWRYRCNGVISLDQTPQAIIESMLTAMAGDAAWQAGQWHIYAGAYRTPTFEITNDDIVGNGIRLQTRVSGQENFNRVRGQFISPQNNWQPDDFPAYKSAVYLAEDNNEEKWADIALPFTISAAAAQRLAKIHLEKQRRQQSINLDGKLSTWRATAGQTVNLTYDRYGFATKPFEARGVTLAIQDGALVPSLILRETSPLVYDHLASEFQIYAAAPTTTLPDALDVAPPTGLTVSESLYETRGSGLKTRVLIQWTAAASAYTDQYQVEARPDSGSAWQVLGRTPATQLEVYDWAEGNWQWRVKALSQLRVSSSYVKITQEIFGLGAIPADVTNLTIQSAGGLAILKWDDHPDLDVRVGGKIVIRHSTALSPSWSSSVSMDTISGAQAIAVVPLKPGNYLVRAEDSQGNVSANPASVNAAGAQIVAVANITSLIADPAFSGTKTDTFVSGSNLTLSSGSNIDSWPDFDAVVNFDAEGGVLPSGMYEFTTVIDLGVTKTIRLRSEIDLIINDIYGDIDSRPGNIDDWSSFDGVDGSEVDVWVEVRTTDDDPAGSPTWGPWGRVDSSELQCRGIDARAILKSYDSSFNPSVSTLRLTVDEAA